MEEEKKSGDLTEVPAAEKISRRQAIKRMALGLGAAGVGLVAGVLSGCATRSGGGGYRDYYGSYGYSSYGYSSYSDYYSSRNSYYSNNFRPNSYFYGSYNAYSSRSYR